MIVAQAAFLAPTASVSLGYSSADVVDPDFARGASTLGDAVMFGGYALAGIAAVVAAIGLALAARHVATGEVATEAT